MRRGATPAFDDGGAGSPLVSLLFLPHVNGRGNEHMLARKRGTAVYGGARDTSETYVGRVYVWDAVAEHANGGMLSLAIVPLPRLDTQGEDKHRLCGRFVRVRNGGKINAPHPLTGERTPVSIGDAQPDAQGRFLFEPGRGGGRIDKVELVIPQHCARSIQAAHFGEVNTYFHLDRMAAYVDDLLAELGAHDTGGTSLCLPGGLRSLPCVTAVVNAHHAATETDGGRDGLWRSGRWLPFQGGHYRLPSRRYDLAEREPIAQHGEIHLGPGWQLLDHGALVELTGRRYRANASHNAGILYHEYGHHITRYTADLRANSLRHPDQQDNRKTALDEGTCDYWAATMLDTPHIWAWHRRHDAQELHPRSLASAKTMDDFDTGPGADAHANGTIWAASLWDMRQALRVTALDGIRRADLLVLQTLLLLGMPLRDGQGECSVKEARRFFCRARESFAVGLAALLEADELLYGGRYDELILASFARRGIHARAMERMKA